MLSNCLLIISIVFWDPVIKRDMVGTPLTDLRPPHFCAFPKPAHTFSTSYLQWCEMRCDCSFFSILIELLVVYGYEQISIWGGTTGSDTVRMLDQKWRHQKSRDFSPYFFFRIFFRYLFPQYFFPRTFSNYFISISSYFFSPYFFPVHFFPVLFFPRTLLLPFYFPVLFPMSRRLKSNVLKYQLVVFLEHVVITQFMYLAKYSFKRHPLGFTWTSGVCACAIWRDQKWIYLT